MRRRGDKDGSEVFDLCTCKTELTPEMGKFVGRAGMQQKCRVRLGHGEFKVHIRYPSRQLNGMNLELWGEDQKEDTHLGVINIG